jgi:hypothetical protein
MYCVILHPKETTRNVLITEKTVPTAAAIGTLIRRSTPPELIGTWKWNALTLSLYGYKTGKAGTENKHELPPPHDTVLLFGEAVVVATKHNVVVNFTSNEYMKFYNESMGGFEDLGSEDSEEEDEEEEELSEKEDAAEEAVEEEQGQEEDLEEEEATLPVPKIVAKKSKRSSKLPMWFTLPELEKEPYAT